MIIFIPPPITPLRSIPSSTSIHLCVFISKQQSITSICTLECMMVHWSMVPTEKATLLKKTDHPVIHCGFQWSFGPHRGRQLLSTSLLYVGILLFRAFWGLVHSARTAVISCVQLFSCVQKILSFVIHISIFYNHFDSSW